ncbi:hypothetical protein PVAND_006150 [Polypedilum vanderplanki]|uniref:RRM domain-containing protein n=1 Tax=Polypedilum vanderplanki TaxID=319348 RepID=A0A9J6C2P9_POLVA|nr:hypothetical protein PVAND_006150 [Polypedilum vanderplanki]
MDKLNFNKQRNNESCGDGVRTENFIKLIDFDLNENVAEKLDDIFKTGKLSFEELDERAIAALKEFGNEGALEVLNKFMESSLEYVNNKSAFLCGIMKTYRQKMKAIREGVPLETLEKSPIRKGPSAEIISKILSRTGYELDVTTGQRKYFLPNSDSFLNNCSEVFCGRIPKEIFEDELVELFEQVGPILDLRLMMDPLTGMNRGYAFITFLNPDSAKIAEKTFNNYEIRPKRCLKVNISVPNKRIFIGNIPKMKTKFEIFEEFNKLTTGLRDVIIYSSPNENKNNRGFCFLEYDTHKNASLAKRRLGSGKIKVWSCDIIVDWADPIEQPDDEIMNQVKVLYVRNIVQQVTEDMLRAEFQFYGGVERVKKIKDFAFIHFEKRQNAELAMRSLNGFEMCGTKIEVTLAKPPADKKKKEEIFRARERRMHQIIKSRCFKKAINPTYILSPNDISKHSIDVGLRYSNRTGQPVHTYLPMQPSLYISKTSIRPSYDSDYSINSQSI